MSGNMRSIKKLLLCFENAIEDVYYYTTLSYVLHTEGLLHFPFPSIQIPKKSWKKTIRYSNAVNRSERKYNDHYVSKIRTNYEP